MDSHLIYNASKALKNKITWDRVTADSEWIHIGTANTIRKEFIIDAIINHFTDNVLLIASTRKESVQIIKGNIGNVIDGFLANNNFIIWDTTFKKAIEFNAIGTMRCGQLNTIK